MTVLIQSTTRDVAIDALRDKLDALRTDVRLRRFDYFDKADVYGRMHRNRMAAAMVDVRRAIRDLQPPRWPAWYATEPLMAYHVEGR